MILLRTKFLFIFLLLPSVAFGDVVDLEASRRATLFQKLVGDYVSDDLRGGDVLASIEANTRLDILDFSYLFPERNWPARPHLVIPLSISEDHVDKNIHGNTGKMIETFHQQIKDNEIMVNRIFEGRTRRIEEFIRLRIEDGLLYYLFGRNYFKRRYLFWGDWVVDTESFDAQNRSITREDDILIKISDKPRGFSGLREVGRTRLLSKVTRERDEAFRRIRGENVFRFLPKKCFSIFSN